METIFSMSSFLDVFTLSLLEIILGIDNVIFIALIVLSLPEYQRKKVRLIGLILAFVMRVIMLFGASWIAKLTDPLMTIFNFEISGRSILMFLGGMFLIVKSFMELIELFSCEEKPSFESSEIVHKKYINAISQVVFVDLILSFDSVMTAVGMTSNLPIIIIAVIIAMIVMYFASEPVGNFISKNPSIKVIALCFIILVGVMLLFNSFNIEFDKKYLYVTMFFSTIVEFLNIMLRKREKNV